MKKLHVTVNGVHYDVEVEIVEDTDSNGHHHLQSYGMPSTQPQPASAANASDIQPKTALAEDKAKGLLTEDKKVLTSPIAGIIVEVKGSVGAVVNEHEPLVVIEAMKMNTNISSPVSGKIKEIKVKPKDPVQQGQVLVVFE